MFSDTDFTVHAIGWVENAYDQRAPSEEIRSVESRLVIQPALQLGLTGLQVGQHIRVVFYFDRSAGYELLQHPRGDQSRPKRGVFALNSPNRPNKIGVTEVEILAIEGAILRVSGLDALNGTPILDIKPAWTANK